MYSVGLHQKGLPELFAVDIPVELVHKVHYLLDMIAENFGNPRKNFHGYKVEAENLWLETLHVTKESDRHRTIKSMGFASASARIVMVKPLWDTWDSSTAPTIRQERILGKWKQYREDHLPPPGSGLPASALLAEALKGSGWQEYLTPKEIKYVKENKDYMMRAARSELCFPPMDKADAFLKDVAASVHLAPQRYRRGIKVAQGNYTWEI